MSRVGTQPNWTARIVSLFATVLVLVGGLWWFKRENRDTEPATVVATSCSGFEADAHKLFDKGDIAALSGTFAPGDHVHLTIDFKGVGYSWELTGVLAKPPDVIGYGWWTTATGHTTSTASDFPATKVSFGDINGFLRLDLEIDVTAAGDGALTVNKTGSVPLFLPPRIVSASCRVS